LCIVGTAADFNESLDRVAELNVDVVLLDTATARAVELVRRLRETTPVKTVLFAVDNDESAIIASAEAGVAGYLASDASFDELTTTLMRVTRGEVHCPPMVATALMRHLQEASASAREHPCLVGLTAREHEVLTLIDAGLSNKEVAVRLRIEVATVKNHVHHLLEKLKVTSRGAAAAQLGRRHPARRLGR
jgi:DNA-binding NarL/FixJ family response regulator